jgi:hypothetical protein
MNTATTSNETNTPKSDGGYTVGQSATDLIGFYGATPLAQQSGSGQAAVTITATTALATATISQVATSGKWAFASSTVALAYVARIKQMQVDIEAVGVLLNQLRSDIVDLGLIKGSS